jgi:hypothetical protein
MFTTLTIAMSLTGAVPVEAPSIKANLDRPAVVQIAAADEFSSQRRDRNRRFGQGNISSGKNKGAERKLGDGLRRVGSRIREIANDGKGLIGVELAAPPGGNKPFGNGKGSNQQVFGNAKGSNAPAFGNGKGSNVGFGNGVGSNAPPPVGYKVGVPAGNAAPQGYSTGAPQGYATGHGNKGYAGQGQGSGNNGGYNTGHGQTGNTGGHNAGQAQQNPPLKIEPGLIPNTGNTGNGNNNAGQPAKLDELRQQIENATNKKS